jgi:hypothetical protein
MNRQRCFVLGLVCLLAGVASWGTQMGRSQDADKEQGASAPAKPRGRLPVYYAQVVSEEQREEIYSIQASYAAQIDALEAQIETLLDERDAKIREVLTPEQRKEVDDLAAAARARRQQPKQAADPAASEQPKSDASGAKKPAKPKP